MTETNFFLQIEPLSSPYSDPCSQVQSEIAFMRKTVRALPPVRVGKSSLCTSFLTGKNADNIITVPPFRLVGIKRFIHVEVLCQCLAHSDTSLHAGDDDDD